MKEEPKEGKTWEEIPTFAPELSSDPKIREKVRSSGYGSEKVVVKKVVLEDNDIRPWQEVPTFTPELVPSTLRESARSSGYGSVIPEIKKPEPETPAFKPEIKRSSVGEQVYESAKSSAYGRVLATPPRPSSAPQPAFRPELPKSTLRESARSSGYGKVLPQSRPSTAPGNEENGSPRTKYVPRYTLLADRSDKQQQQTPSKPEKDFVLDGVAMTSQRHPIHGGFGPVPPVPDSPLSRSIKEKASSSRYFEYQPPVGEKKEASPSVPALKFDRSHSVLEQPLEAFPPKTPLADKVRSSAYGVESPARVERPEPAASEPKWGLTYKAAIPNELPPPPVNALNASVGSHGYGTASPEKGQLVEYKPEPLWVPPARSTGFPVPPPVPRSSLNDSVSSHYGANYQPHNPYSAGFEDSQMEDEEHHRSTSSAITRTVKTTTKKVVEEYEVDGNEQVDEHEEY